MTVLLEFREGIRSFYGKYEVYLLPVIKFLLASSVFLLINHKIGYMERLDHLPFLLILSLACSILPVAVMVLAAGALVSLHCYALSMPAGVIMLVLFVVMYLLYFRFAPGCAYNVLLTPIACVLGIPYVMPAANGLLQQPVAVIPTICGVVTYYFLEGITANETSLGTNGEEEELIGRFQEIIRQFVGNREMYLMIAVFIIVTLVVYLLRRLSADYAWTIAMVAGAVVNITVLLVGDLMFDTNVALLEVVLGNVLSLLLAVVLQFFVFNVDYSRTEKVQFEDDEYYYYVKAVPKIVVARPEKKVKQINSQKTKAAPRTRTTH